MSTWFRIYNVILCLRLHKLWKNWYTWKFIKRQFWRWNLLEYYGWSVPNEWEDFHVNKCWKWNTVRKSRIDIVVVKKSRTNYPHSLMQIASVTRACIYSFHPSFLKRNVIWCNARSLISAEWRICFTLFYFEFDWR